MAVRIVFCAVLVALLTAPVAERAALEAFRVADDTAPFTMRSTAEAGAGGRRFGFTPVTLINSMRRTFGDFLEAR